MRNAGKRLNKSTDFVIHYNRKAGNEQGQTRTAVLRRSGPLRPRIVWPVNALALSRLAEEEQLYTDHSVLNGLVPLPGERPAAFQLRMWVIPAEKPACTSSRIRRLCSKWQMPRLSLFCEILCLGRQQRPMQRFSGDGKRQAVQAFLREADIGGNLRNACRSVSL